MKVYIVCYKIDDTDPLQLFSDSKAFIDKEMAQYYASELNNDMRKYNDPDGSYVVESMKVADGR